MTEEARISFVQCSTCWRMTTQARCETCLKGEALRGAKNDPLSKADATTECGCWKCLKSKAPNPRPPFYPNKMVVCGTCGNKRCPKANNHENACTNSNEPGQAGSAYADANKPAIPGTDAMGGPIHQSANLREALKWREELLAGGLESVSKFTNLERLIEATRLNDLHLLACVDLQQKLTFCDRELGRTHRDLAAATVEHNVTATHLAHATIALMQIEKVASEYLEQPPGADPVQKEP